jgi:hypothetical protein
MEVQGCCTLVAAYRAYFSGSSTIFGWTVYHSMFSLLSNYNNSMGLQTTKKTKKKLPINITWSVRKEGRKMGKEFAMRHHHTTYLFYGSVELIDSSLSLWIHGNGTSLSLSL